MEKLDIQSFVKKGSSIKDTLIHIESTIKSIEFEREKNIVNHSFASRLKELRKNKGVSQDELSKYLNVSRSTIANYESGTSEPSIKTIKDLAVYFNTSTDYLLGLYTPRKSR